MPPRPLAALSTSSPAPSGPCEPFCPARPLREDAPSSPRAAQSSSPLCGCLRAPLSRSLCRRSRAPSLHLRRLDGVSLSRMALAAFRSCPCELLCSRCFAPLSPPPLSPVLRPPRVRAMCSALCGLHALLPPVPSPSSPSRAAALTGPLPAARPKGERGVCPSPQSLLPAPAFCPFRPSRFAPGAFPGRPLYSALCRCPRRLCLPSSALRVSAPCALPCVAFARFCRPPPRPLAVPCGCPHGPPTRCPPQRGKRRLSAPTKPSSRARALPLSPSPGLHRALSPAGSRAALSAAPPGHPATPVSPQYPARRPLPRPCVRRQGRGAKEKDPFFPLGKRSPIKRRKSVDRRDNLYYTDILYQNGYLCLC